jgi:DNA-binding NarL/FixJ family response regulator
MPEIGGIEAVQLIKKADPDAHIVMEHLQVRRD